MTSYLFPGTFDPPTLGHLDIIGRAAQLCDHLLIGVAENSQKKALFTVEERVKMIEEITRGLKNVKVISFSGLVVDFAQKNAIAALVKGLRTVSDFDFELTMAMTNRKMTGIETLFLVSGEGYSHISSTLIREIAASGGHLESFVPKEILTKVYAKASQRSSPKP